MLQQQPFSSLSGNLGERRKASRKRPVTGTASFWSCWLGNNKTKSPTPKRSCVRHSIRCKSGFSANVFCVFLFLFSFFFVLLVSDFLVVGCWLFISSFVLATPHCKSHLSLLQWRSAHYMLVWANLDSQSHQIRLPFTVESERKCWCCVLCVCWLFFCSVVLNGLFVLPVLLLVFFPSLLVLLSH